MVSQLRGAAASGRGVAECAEEERAMQRVKMRQQRGNFGEERIAEDRGYLFVAAAAGVADQVAHFHAQSEGEPLQRAQSGNRLAVFDFRNVGARHLHPSSELALAQVTGAAHFPHLPCYLRTGVAAIGHRLAGHKLWE